MSRSLRVVSGLLILSALAWVLSSKMIFARLVYLWGTLIVGSWLWSRWALRGIQFQRSTLVENAQVGQVFSEQFEIVNLGRLPVLWLEVNDRSELPGASGSRVLTLIKGRQNRSYISRNRLLQRGVFPLGPTTLIGGDVFGLFRVAKTIPENQSLLVLPAMVNVPAFPHPPGLLSGGEALHRKTQQVTTNAAGLREYAPGDSWNRIHWASTAHRDRLMVKEFELDPRSDVWLFLDGEQASQAVLPFTWSAMLSAPLWRFFSEVEIPPATEEYGVNITASLARYYLENGRAVGMVENGEHFSVVAPDRGHRQLGKILQDLALYKACSEIPFTGVISNHASNIPRGSTTIVVTPSLSDELTLCLDNLSRLGLRPILILMDVATFGGEPGSTDLLESIRRLGIPARMVAKGDDLGVALSKTVIPLWGRKAVKGMKLVYNAHGHKLRIPLE